MFVRPPTVGMTLFLVGQPKAVIPPAYEQQHPVPFTITEARSIFRKEPSSFAKEEAIYRFVTEICEGVVDNIESCHAMFVEKVAGIDITEFEAAFENERKRRKRLQS